MRFILQIISSPINQIFGLTMIALVIYFIWQLIKYNSTKKEIKKLIILLKSKGFTSSQLIETSEFKVLEKDIKAFNHSLIYINNIYYITSKPDVYFNNINLLEEKINMKSITNIPQIFPGLGILGTFIGLAFGLSTVKTTGGSESILKSIQPLLDNISVAFITSILGILFSIIVTFILNEVLGMDEKRILELEDEIIRKYPLYTKIRQGEELLKEIKEIKTTTNGLATDISNQLGEHISNEVGDKMDNLISGSNTIMTDLSRQIGDTVETLTSTLSNDFGENISEALDKVFTDDLVNNFKGIGEDVLTISKENLENMEVFKKSIGEIILDLRDLVYNYEIINDKTTSTNKNITDSLNYLSENIEKRVTTVDESLEKTAIVFNNASLQIEELEKSLSTSLKDTSLTMDKISEYMKINQDINNSMSRFIDSEEKILELWNGYDEKFTNLNHLLIEGSSRFEESLKTSVTSYKNQLNGIRDEFSTMMGSLNQKYVDYTTDNTVSLFKEYDKHLSVAINKFNNLIGTLGEEVESLQEVIGVQNEKLELVMDNVENKNTIKIEKE